MWCPKLAQDSAVSPAFIRTSNMAFHSWTYQFENSELHKMFFFVNCSVVVSWSKREWTKTISTCNPVIVTYNPVSPYCSIVSFLRLFFNQPSAHSQYRINVKCKVFEISWLWICGLWSPLRDNTILRGSGTSRLASTWLCPWIPVSMLSVCSLKLCCQM